MQSCKALGNEPFAYLRDVLDRVSTLPVSRVDDLLPDRRVLPERAAAHLVGRHRSRPRASAHFYDDLVNFAALRPPL